MKQIRNLGILLLAVAMTTTACGQKVKNDDVPAVVVKSLTGAYPYAKRIKWDKESPNYEANFDNDKKEYSVLLSATGEILETEVEIPNSELPAAILDYMKNNYPDQKINETAMITKENGEQQYEVEIKAGDLIFDGSRQLVKSDLKSKKKEENEDEEGEDDED